MPSYVAIPKLGMAMTEATVVAWQADEGAHVDRGDVVVTIETDKTEWDVEAQAPGWLHVLVSPEETVPVGRVIALLADDEAELAALQKQPPPVLMATEAALPAEPESGQLAAPPPAPGRRSDVRVSPVAKKIAEEHRLDLRSITGSGPDGRIVRQDVERALAALAEAPAPTARSVAAVPPAERGAVTGADGSAAAQGQHAGKRIAATLPLKGMRRAIAEHMHSSLSASAQLTYMGEAEMTQVVELRHRLLAHEERLGAHITYTDIIVVAVARALADVPILNSSLVGDEIKIWADVNIGVAVALDRGIEGGLIVPVVRNVDQKPLRQVSGEIASLVERARNGRLLPDDVAGGTFTVTNIATVGGGWFVGTPIINQPQSAILAVGAITDRAVVRDGAVVVREMMPYSLTFDHRVVDGAPAARFAARLTELLAEPALFLA
jgi:pyruvate dehydrogenase E2 component (dihydrolipoamide acetyltransferase)/2-oxoglutarate dehydrogenase E2 component (dihydrolipoamide succinyltransferase)